MNYVRYVSGFRCKQFKWKLRFLLIYVVIYVVICYIQQILSTAICDCAIYITRKVVNSIFCT